MSDPARVTRTETTVTTTTRVTLDEEQAGQVLAGALFPGVDPKIVEVNFDVSGQGFLRTVTLTRVEVQRSEVEGETSGATRP